MAERITQQTGLNKLNVKSIAFSLIVIPVVGTIVWIVNSQGIRISIAIFGMKLYKIPIPGFSYLGNFKNLRDLDLAHAFAIFMLFAVWMLSVALLEMLLFGVDDDKRMNVNNHIRFLFCISGVVILSDIVMFYRGIADQGGLLDSGGGLTSLIATVGYSGLLAFVAYVHVMLKRRIY